MSLTQVKGLGFVSRIIISIILGFTVTAIFMGVALFGVTHTAAGAFDYYSWPLAPGLGIAGLLEVLGTGPEQFFPVLWMNALFYAGIVFIPWEWRTRRHR